MALSQFDTAVLGGSAIGKAGAPTMKVGGPLLLDPRGDYADTVAIHFVIIQSAEGADEHDPLKARRARGYVEVPSAQAKTPQGRWDTQVDAGDLVAGKPARGIGVAVIEYLKPYAYESYTWCDFIPPLNGEPASAA